MDVQLRKFEKGDIPNKVRWINDDKNNRYLHYDLPLSIEKTEAWFEKNQKRQDRYDAVILYQGQPVGIIGLLAVEDGRAEYYITLGERAFQGRGIAKEATKLLLSFGFDQMGLQEIYLYTEIDNLPAQRLFERCGFVKKERIANSAMNRGKPVDRYLYSISKGERKEG